jgi:uridine kinase
VGTLFIGVAGGTGSGKTTISQALVAGLPRNRVALIQHDSYYRDRNELTYEQRSEVNYDHPSSLETELFVQHLDDLRAGRGIDMPQYDFATHRRKTETVRVDPSPVVIVEGILVLAEPSIRDRLDVKLYVDTAADIRLMRRIRRDIEMRGRSFSQIRRQYYDTVRPMHLAFVEPSKAAADVIIPEGGENQVAVDMVLSKVLHWLQKLGV